MSSFKNHSWAAPMRLFIAGCFAVVLGVPMETAAQDAAEWKRRIESAPAGQTISLPEGEIALGDVAVPAGVQVRGAGYRKTVINAAAFRNGFVLSEIKECQISDLAVRGARGSAVSSCSAPAA